MTKDGKIVGADRPYDLFERSAEQSFFELAEMFALYERTRPVYRRRDMHERMIELYDRWFSIEQRERLSVIASYISTSSLKLSSKYEITSDWRDAPIFFPKSCLGNVSDLKAAYRSAALKCHPDLGGSHNAMIKLNETFQALHRQIIDGPQVKTSMSDDRHYLLQPEWARIRTFYATVGEHSKDFFFLPQTRDMCLQWHYVGILVDDWNIDGAVKFIVANGSMIRAFDKFYGFEVASHGSALTITTKLFRRSRALGRPKISAPIRILEERPYETRFRIILTHPRQHINVDRLQGKRSLTRP